MKSVLNGKLKWVPWKTCRRKLRVLSTQIESGRSEMRDNVRYPRVIPHHTDDRSPEALQYERESLAKFCQRLPCTEKIDFVSPYERPWSQSEYYHYSKHRAPLFRPRKSFRVKAVPQSYNLLPFYKFITKSHHYSFLPDFYYDQKLPSHLEKEFLRECQEAMDDELSSGSISEAYRFLPDTPPNISKSSDALEVQKIAETLVQTLLRVYGPEYPDLLSARFSRKSRQETFWVRGGFRSLYDQEKLNDPIERHRLKKITGDDRRRIGELSFCFREESLANIRVHRPLEEIVDWSDESKTHFPVDPYVYNPRILGLWPETDPLYQAPGFEPGSGETHAFPLLNIIDMTQMLDRFRYWRCDPDEMVENLWAMAIASSFAPLVAHAHSLGFNYLNDLTYPLVGQTMLLGVDGTVAYAAYQLNTLDLASEWKERTGRTNLCWTSERYKLFDDHGNLETKALRPLLHFALNPPRVEREGEEGLTPYLRGGDGGPLDAR